MKYVLCLLLLVSAKVSFTQNLVPNPSFETLVNDSCFNGPTNWTLETSSPDYYNICFAGSNVFGYQNPADGDAYFGLYTRVAASYPNYREFIGTQIPTLTIGTKYFVSFKAVSASCMNCFTSKIGALFTFSPLQYTSTQQFLQLPNHAQVFYDSILSDSINWTTVSGSFIADSQYNYLFLGCFFDEAHSDSALFQAPQCYLLGGGPLCTAYYYVDAVCVSTDSSNCHMLHSTISHQPVQSKLYIYPTLINQTLNITFPQGSTQFNIFNAIGQRVLSSNTTSLYQAVDVSGFSEGIYFVSVQTHQGVQTAKFVVQR
ncbi:MAG TPA: T9SS type A sorting domain-containing protein [Chitinophagales bacterium]|nr:T9SS type A sorting domain-containing protein [Chitinophagales bacterium]